jgi:hypothetical protein
MVRIVLMVIVRKPNFSASQLTGKVYVLGSYLSLLLRKQAFYFTLFRDVLGILLFLTNHKKIRYEAYVLYMFFRLLIELAEGEDALAAKLERVKEFR